MKKIVIATFTSVLLTVGYASAGTNAGSLDPNNGKDQRVSTSEKDDGKYSFTLFSFFTQSESKVKTDTVSTKNKALKRKSTEPINSGL